MKKEMTLDEIQKIYTDVSEWLKFAEAKHAGLFAVWTAVFIAYITSDLFTSICTIQNVIIIVIIFIGIGINAFALSPFINRIKCLRKGCYNKYKTYSNDNVVFYQSIFIKTYSENNDVVESLNKYMKVLMDRGFPNLNDKLVQDYMRQVIEVSTVGTIKVYLFNIATKYVYLIMILLVVALIIA
jgi:hypothetical protein